MLIHHTIIKWKYSVLIKRNGVIKKGNDSYEDGCN